MRSEWKKHMGTLWSGLYVCGKVMSILYFKCKYWADRDEKALRQSWCSNLVMYFTYHVPQNIKVFAADDRALSQKEKSTLSTQMFAVLCFNVSKSAVPTKAVALDHWQYFPWIKWFPLNDINNPVIAHQTGYFLSFLSQSIVHSFLWFLLLPFMGTVSNAAWLIIDYDNSYALAAVHK